MNLTKLFETQRILDTRIEKEHPRVEGEERLAKKILSLLVELGELANEQRSWKFWSNDQEPRITKTCSFCNGLGSVKLSDHKKTCRRCGGKGSTGNPLLEEYVDCLHFILSIGLEIGEEYFDYNQNHTFKERDITIQFLRVIDYTIGLREDDYCSELLESFTHLGEMLGFTWEQVEEAYYAKNKINHERQESGY
ncbi:dUTP diphosphatase [Psychrobacillus sp. NEAU-3TGS]|uniref:dUTP diphosphatase n=1 Tax=Psychrobacillus sp. NEAU-3TGS TaxID=2995412 RepID=UPI0024997011|nr:dUTP diphosphatase [Psychrobacillus sp. NEAU-3TGS]MDI2588077.1 dUTP diphosphatase [Psychrobacillus sp. NEAU-3TGS]